VLEHAGRQPARASGEIERRRRTCPHTFDRKIEKQRGLTNNPTPVRRSLNVVFAARATEQQGAQTRHRTGNAPAEQPQGEIVMNTEINMNHAQAHTDANSQSSWFFKSGWADTYFREVPEGQVFTCLPWVFGRSREYRLSNAQAQELVARMGRAFTKAVYLMIGSVALIIATVLSFLAFGPIVAGVAGGMVAVTLVGVFLGMVYRAAGSVLAGLSWTSVPREPYNPLRNLKRTTALMMLLPTWALVAGAALSTISVMKAVIAPFTSGNTHVDVMNLATQLAMSLMFGVALNMKLRAQRNAG
jgi:hypothetical protein